MLAGLLAACLFLGTPAWADDDVDPLALASRLIADRYWDRAAGVLDQVDTTKLKKDATRFFTLRGLVRLRQRDYQGAVDDLRIAAEAEDADPLVNLQLAQGYLGLKQPADALTALDAGGEAVANQSSTYLLRAQAHRIQEDLPAAWEALSQGLQRFPDHEGLAREQVFLLVDLGLFRQGLEQAYAVFDTADTETWAKFGNKLREAGDLDSATEWLEDGLVRYPTDTTSRKLLAQVCLQQERPLCAGEVLQVAAQLEPGLADEAAESFRRAGAYDRALYMNGLVTDPGKKASQRLGILLQMERFTQVIALEPRLRRLGLLTDQNLIYALAYGFYKVGRHEDSERLLRQLTDPTLFQQAAALREAMATCATSPSGCY